MVWDEREGGRHQGDLGWEIRETREESERWREEAAEQIDLRISLGLIN